MAPASRVVSRTMLRSCLHVVLLGLSACAAPTERAAPAPPADTWSLSFEYREGYRSDPIEWGVTIASEGLCRAWWQRWAGVHWCDPFDPTPEMRERLREAVDAAGLREMPELLAGGSDSDWMILVLREDGDVHRVRAANAVHLAGQPAPDDIARRDAIRRFLGVVIEVLRLQPSPIEGQTVEAYERLIRTD